MSVEMVPAIIDQLSNGAGPVLDVSHLGEIRKIPAREHRGLAALQLLWNERTVLLKWAMWGLVLSTILAFLLPTYYSSSTRIMPPTQDSAMGLAALSALSRAGGDSLGMMAGSLLGIRSSGALFMGIMHSRMVEDEIIDHFDLRKVYSVKLGEDARKKLERNTNIVEDRQSGIITVTVTDHDPHRASHLANAYVEELNSRLAQVNTSAAHKERVFIEQQIKDTKQVLDDASRNFSQFASKNTAIDIKEQGKAMVEGAARLQGELIAAQSELKGLEQIYMPKDIRVRSLHARVEELQNQLQKLNGGSNDAADGDANDPAAYPSIKKLPLLGVTYFDLYRQTKIQETVYEILNQEYQLAKIQEAKELPNARVLDPPDMPERKAGPLRTIIVLVGLILFATCGVVWVLARNLWNGVDPDDPRKKLTRDVLATGRQRLRMASSFPVLSRLRRILARSRHTSNIEPSSAESIESSS
jgi:capsule polysaccharide export protein KpsE/RkpR